MGRPTDGEPGAEDGRFEECVLTYLVEADPSEEDEAIPVGSAEDCDEEVSGDVLDFGVRAVAQSIQVDYSTFGAQLAALPEGHLEAFFSAFDEMDFLAEFFELTEVSELETGNRIESKTKISTLTGMHYVDVDADGLERVHSTLDGMITKADAFKSERPKAEANARTLSMNLAQIKANLTKARWAALFA